MNIKPKVLVAGPIFDGMECCSKTFIERIKSLSYDNYDILLVDNSKNKDFSKNLKKRYGINVIHLPLENISNMKKIIRCRNRILTHAMQNSYDYVLMMDSDVIPPINILNKLLDHKKDIVSGIYFGVFNVDRRQKVESVAWKGLTEEEFEEIKDKISSEFVTAKEHIRRHLTKEEIESNELQEVIIPSPGCMLISNKVFRKIRYGLLDVPKGFRTGDDIYFCRHARESGFKLYCDPSIRCEHLTEGKFRKDGEEWVHPLHE